jgi:hypothetical protein
LNTLERTGNVSGCQSESVEACRIDLDLNLSSTPADAGEIGDPRYRDDRSGYRVIDEPTERLLIHVGARDGIGQERSACIANDLVDHRLLKVRGQVAPRLVDGLFDVDQRVRQIASDLELNRHRHLSFSDHGSYVFEPLESRDGIFDPARDLGFQLRGRRAGQAQRDLHRRYIQIRKILHSQTMKAHQACERHQRE